MALAFVAFAAAAQTPESGLSFFHKDWQLACDNTRTCRAAGYHAEGTDDAAGVSVLLTRRAGPGERVTAWLKLASWSDGSRVADLPEGSRLSMWIDGRALGTIAWVPDSDGLALNGEQTESLLQALVGTGNIAWKAGGHAWTLSNRGATAVLLKMDEFQGRVGSWGALVDFGENDESAVRQALAPPVVQAVATDDGFVTLSTEQERQLLRELQAGQSHCAALSSEENLSVRRLGRDRLLVSAACWSAGYNRGSGFWVTHVKTPFLPVLVTEWGTRYGAGIISASQKGRGLGDCWAHQEWVWDGAAFVQTSLKETGMCRLIAPGGAWEVPTLVTTVIPAGR